MVPEDIYLVSDFHDFMDHNFAREYSHKELPIFKRLARSYFSKVDQFNLLENHCISVPPHGIVRQLLDEFSYENLIIYDDMFAHRAMGKHFQSGEAAYKQYPNHYCSAFIRGVSDTRSISYRSLWIGNEGFLLRYESNNTWASNLGDEVDIRFENRLTSRMPCEYPLFAIDYVEDYTGKRWAVDFNTAPQLKGTPIQEMYKPREVAQFIADWYEHGRL